MKGQPSTFETTPENKTDEASDEKLHVQISMPLYLEIGALKEVIDRKIKKRKRGRKRGKGGI